MKISTKGRYALRVMIDLAENSDGKYVSLKDIASRQEISLKYLEQIVSTLNKAKMITSARGNIGGYKLTKEPKDYIVGDILKVMEGMLAPTECVCTNDCSRIKECKTYGFWKGLDEVIISYINSKTLEDLL